MAVAGIITVAFRGGDPPPDVIVQVMPTAADGGSASPPAMETPATPPATKHPTASGFAYPIPGACLPTDDNLMPNAPREYRRGIHEGVDFYDSDNCAFIDLGTEVLAAKAGTVTRADWAYEDLTAETLAQLQERVELEGGDDPDVVDAFRGRQVWVDHGDGSVSRYAHLSGVAEGIVTGAEVEQGTAIGYVGDSGTPESVTAPGTQSHLHFEIRIGDICLGQGLSPEDARFLFLQAFSQ
jgi:murein DD-endopeptidase MepM/ murein hydrolase activator NlpD